MMIIYVLLIAAVIILVWGIAEYNFFATAGARIKAAIQEIGNQLKRQADLIPNLESATKGYLKHEKGIFTELSEARKAVAAAVKGKNPTKMAEAGSKIAEILPKIQVVVESNPEIKGSGVVTRLMDELRDTADKVMYARRLVIDLTADYNVKRVTIPSSLIARIFGFKEMEGMIMEDEGESRKVKKEDLKTPKISL
jgi:LemA protein